MNNCLRYLFRMIFIIFICLFVVSCGNNKQEFSHEQKFSATELKKDLKRLRHFALEEHPALLSKAAKNRFIETYDRTLFMVKDSMKLIDFYILARKLVGEINCGHTRLQLPENYWGKLSDEKKHFPFKIYYSENRMFIKENYSKDYSLLPGSEILSINDKKS